MQIHYRGLEPGPSLTEADLAVLGRDDEAAVARADVAAVGEVVAVMFAAALVIVRASLGVVCTRAYT
jgi:hypothetical protein